MRLKNFPPMFIGIMLLAGLAVTNMPVPVQSSPASVTFYVKMPPEGYISGVPVGQQFGVDIYVESDITPNTTEGIVGWGIDVQVDPTVLKPLGASGAGEGYFLYDFLVDYEYIHPPFDMPYKPILLVGSTNKTTGYMDEVTEQITPTTPKGAGGTGKLVTLWFKSLNETAYSPIKISLYEEGEWQALYMDAAWIWHWDAAAIDGHYNEQPVHDVAVADVSAPPEAAVGDLVPINVDVWNLGKNPETFDLEVLYDTTLIETRQVSLGLGEFKTESFSWNTGGVTPGNYTLNATAIITDDNPTNNWKTTTINLTLLGGDVAVVNVLPSESQAFPAWTINVNVTVLNNDTSPIDFNVTAYYDTTEIGTKTVTNFAPGNQTTLTFDWPLTVVPYGLYDIKANATLADDINPDNNEFVVYDAVKVKLPGDADGNGSVGGGDFAALGWGWGTSVGQPKYNPQCDFDGGGTIGGGDFATLGWNWGKSVTY